MRKAENEAGLDNAIRQRPINRLHQRSVLMVIGLLAVGLAIFSVTVGPHSQHGQAFAHYVSLISLLGVIIALFTVLGAASLRRGGLDVLEPPVWYSLWTLMGLAVFGFAAFLDARYLHPAVSDVGWLADGLWLPILGLLGLWIGYRLAWGFPVPARSHGSIIPNRKSRWQAPRFGLVWALYVLICILRVWRITVIGVAYGADPVKLGELARINQWMAYLEQSTYMVIAIVALQVFKGQWHKRSLWIMLLAELIFAFMSGFMKPFMWLGLVLYGAHRYTRHRLRFRRGPVLLVVAAFIVVVPMTEEFRLMVATGQINTCSVVSVMSGVGEALRRSWGAGVGSAFDTLLGKVTRRQAGVAQMWGIVVNTTPATIPHWGVENLLMIPAYVVPRALWPTKPVLSRGVEFNIRYLGAPPTTVSSVAYTMYGGLYLNAGWPAVFVGMMVLGIVTALLYRHLVVQPLRNGQLAPVALYLGLVVPMLDVDSSYIENMVGLLHRLIVFGLLFLLLHGHSSKRAVDFGGT